MDFVPARGLRRPLRLPLAALLSQELPAVRARAESGVGLDLGGGVAYRKEQTSRSGRVEFRSGRSLGRSQSWRRLSNSGRALSVPHPNNILPESSDILSVYCGKTRRVRKEPRSLHLNGCDQDANGSLVVRPGAGSSRCRRTDDVRKDGEQERLCKWRSCRQMQGPARLRLDKSLADGCLLV